MKKSLLNFFANEAGTGAAKYSLIAMLITMAVAAAVTGVGDNLNNMLVSSSAQHHQPISGG